MPKGVIVVRVREAHGRNKRDDVVWEPGFVEGFIRAELRGADRSKIVDQTSTRKVLANEISWDEELRLDVTDQSKELRLMLCREKKSSQSRSGMAVIAACGIYVEDILGAVPINKYFELFKPRSTTSNDGGMIKVSITFEDHGRPRGVRQQEQKPAEAEPRAFQTQLSLGPDDIVASAEPSKETRRRASNLGDLQEEDSDYQESEFEPEAAPITVAEDKPKGSKKIVKLGIFLLLAIGAGAGVLKAQKKGPFKEKSED